MQNTMSEILLPLIAVYGFRFTKGRYENLTKIVKVVYPFGIRFTCKFHCIHVFLVSCYFDKDIELIWSDI